MSLINFGGKVPLSLVCFIKKTESPSIGRNMFKLKHKLVEKDEGSDCSYTML